jgi:hypothetical protein
LIFFILKNSSSYALESVKFAKQLIAYRTRHKDESIPIPSARKLIQVNPKTAVRLETRMANPRKLKAALESAQVQLPAIKLAKSGMAQIFCRHEEFLMVFNENFRDAKAFESLKKEKGIPMLLLRKRECPDEYFLTHYFFTHPSEKGEIILSGVRPGGTITYSGIVKVTKDHFNFSFKTVNNLYFAGLQMSGEFNYELQNFGFTEALSDMTIDRKKNPMKIPKKAGFVD